MKIRQRKQIVYQTLSYKVARLRLYRWWNEYTARMQEEMFAEMMRYFKKGEPS